MFFLLLINRSGAHSSRSEKGCRKAIMSAMRNVHLSSVLTLLLLLLINLVCRKEDDEKNDGKIKNWSLVTDIDIEVRMLLHWVTKII